MLVAAALLVPVTEQMARAQAGPQPASRAANRPSARAGDLHYALPIDMTVTVAATVVWGGTEALKSQLAPLACRWCESNALDSGVRSSLRWTDHGGAAVTASNLGAYLIAPLAGFGLLALSAVHEGEARNIPIDFLIVAEAVALSGTFSQLVKFTVGRQRPYARAGLPNPDSRQGRDDANLSFFSGHTNVTFAIAAASGTVGMMRGYRWAPVVYIVGGVIGAATAYFRIAADQHYFTDVLTGAMVGSAAGVAIPYYLHRPRSAAGARASGGPRNVTLIVTPWSVAGAGGLGCTAVW